MKRPLKSLERLGMPEALRVERDKWRETRVTMERMEGNLSDSTGQRGSAEALFDGLEKWLPRRAEHGKGNAPTRKEDQIAERINRKASCSGERRYKILWSGLEDKDGGS